jgi:hypothetical protein
MYIYAVATTLLVQHIMLVRRCVVELHGSKNSKQHRQLTARHCQQQQVKKMGLDETGHTIESEDGVEPPAFGAAADGDADR